MSDYTAAEHLMATIADLRAELERVKGELEQAHRYIGTEMFRSDFQTAAQMRATLEAVRTERDQLAQAVADAEVAFDSMMDALWKHRDEAEGKAALGRFRNRKVGQ